MEEQPTRVNLATGEVYVVGSKNDPNLSRKPKVDISPKGKPKNSLESITGKVQQLPPTEKSYAVFQGIDPDNGLYVIKFLTRKGTLDFTRFSCGFYLEECRIILHETDHTWPGDPNIKALPYYNELRSGHRDGRIKVVQWDPAAYQLWRQGVDENEGRDARIYDGKNLRVQLKPRDDSDKTDEIKLKWTKNW